MPAWAVLTLSAALLLLVIGLVVGQVRGRSRTRRELRAAHDEALALRAQVDDIERRLATPASGAGKHADTEYVITHLGNEPDPGPAPVPMVDGPLFADLVLRETVVQAASLAHGLRRALAPEMRNRIRFEMRREVKRSRKQRRADLKAARREWEARQRAEVDRPDEEDAA
ncbi:MAG: hypothetical protein JWO11_2286 [Nocardioides sp.]|nr:hypothetical protein [Nocardioides sp.]